VSLKNLYLTIPVGQSVRDFLVLGIVKRLLDLLPNFRIVLLTPSYNVPEFQEICPNHARVVLRRMELRIGNQNSRLIHWRRRRFTNRTAIRMMLKWESRRLRPSNYLLPTLRDLPPSLVVSSHPLTSYDYEIIMWARRLRVQTLGVVKSWDNVGKGLTTPTHRLSVWNPVNKQEAVERLGYLPEEVDINGAPSFDAYYGSAFSVPRDEFFESLGLDPRRRVITLATTGVLDKGYYGRDETHLVDDILRMLEESTILRGAQLIIRLHPVSHLERFWKYWDRPGIRFSFASYIPGITWCPNHRDLIEQTNLLRHSDVIVTPASSWVLEAAIFDTPTVVPLYSELQPDHAAAQFGWALDRHFKPLAENKWVPITHSYLETLNALEETFHRPNKYAEGRKAIVKNYVYYRDGRSCQRVAEWIAGFAERAQPGKPTGF
jgi:hypothetical protein